MINQNRLQKNLEAFSFPRLYGTEAEKKACNIAKEKMEELNTKPTTQKFSFSNYYSIIYPKIAFTLIFLSLFTLYLNINDLFVFLSLTLLTVFFTIAFILSRTTNLIKIGKYFNSENLYTKISASNPENNTKKNKKEIILLAHLDSKGQKMHIVDRVRNYILWSFSLALSILLIILKNALLPQYALLFYIVGIIPLTLNFISVLYIYLNTTNNNSDGALDNASGVTCVLELLNYYSNLDSEMRLKNLNLWFVLTGAEEGGTQGIRRFYKVIKEVKVKKNDFIVLNFDSIGTHIDFVKFGITIHKKKILNIFLNNGKNEDLYIQTRKVYLGVHTDGYYLAKRGYQGLEFGDWDSYQYLHTINDTIDKIDSGTLKKLCDIVINSLLEIDQNC